MDSKEQELRLKIRLLRQELFETEQKLLSLDTPINQAPAGTFTIEELNKLLGFDDQS